MVVALWFVGCVVGNGNVVSEVREVADFDAVRIDNGLELELSVSPDAADPVELEVSAESNLLDAITTEVRGTRLVADVRTGVAARRPMTLRATVSTLDEVFADNAAEVDGTGLEAATLEVSSNNGAFVTLDGTTGRLDVESNNGAEVALGDLTADTATVEVNNGATATICVTGDVVGEVNNGATLTVLCGGDAFGVRARNGGEVR